MGYLREVKGGKADIVIGNPPFGCRDNQLWGTISNKEVFELKDGAVLAFITPQNIVYISKTRGGKGAQIYYLKESMYRYNHIIEMDIKKHFPKVSSSFASWVIQKKSNYSTVLNLSGEMADTISKILYKRKEGVDVILGGDNNTFKKNHLHSETPNEVSKWKLIASHKKVLYSSIRTKRYDEKKVIGSRIGNKFVVREKCGITHACFMYFREGLEYELCHAFNSKLIGKFLNFCKVGFAVPSPVMKQLPNFSDEGLLAIRKAITDAGENVESDTKQLSKETKDKINQIVKDDLRISDDEENTLSGK